ncbi:SRPBCC family protein [Streptomyces sp. RPT161]|uniref:SRPBCC family protein n=1 Tax=Streptomyces sp. RPT161 TaxID=3015993 RepID=UPI0022B8A23C|nr:SRPBCC family protein [Streptomyces sp. RPT161]
MTESTTTKVRELLEQNPATARLKDELQEYLQARAEHALADLGHKLGEGISRLAEPGQGSGRLAASLAKGGKALSEGKTPAQAVTALGKSHLKDALTDKVKGLFGKGRKGGGGKSKSVTIAEDIDVGVPAREAYDQWTQFQEFSTFAKGVVSVEKTDDTSSNWTVKVAKSTRSWTANVTEQVPDERIAWTTSGPKGTIKGVVTFHPLGDNLTRVLLVIEYFPKGLFEKTGNIWRAQGRRARLDLKLYRKFIMLRGEATDGWRGEIRDGKVVRDHEDAEERSAEQHPAEEQAEDDAEVDVDTPHDAVRDDEPEDAERFDDVDDFDDEDMGADEDDLSEDDEYADDPEGDLVDEEDEEEEPNRHEHDEDTGEAERRDDTGRRGQAADAGRR